MARIIISMDRGVVLNVYTDTLEPMQSMVIDEEDETDPERATQYLSCEYLWQQGSMQTCFQTAQAETIQPAQSIEKSGLPQLDEQGFLLVSDFSGAKTKKGRRVQNLENAFVCGYLEASAELSRYIGKLYREKHPMAREIYAVLRPLLDLQSENYFGLCKQINDIDRYDGVDAPELPSPGCGR